MNGIKMVAMEMPGAASQESVNAYLRSLIKKPETLSDLLQLSGRALYMQNKLEKLKELSPDHYKLKYSEFFGYNPDGSPLYNSAAIEQENGLNELLKLSGQELFMNDRFEELKEVNLYHFKLKYKEFFGVEYKG